MPCSCKPTLGIDNSFNSIQKKKKSLVQMKKKEDDRKKDLLYFTIQSWIPENNATMKEELSRAFLIDYLKTIEELVKLMGYDFAKDNLFLPTLIYADRFMKKSSMIPYGTKQLLLLILVSALAAVKMWEDWGTDSVLVEEVTGITRKQVSQMEKVFLATLDYNLCVSSEEINQWKQTQQKLIEEQERILSFSPQSPSSNIVNKIEEFRIQ